MLCVLAVVEGQISQGWLLLSCLGCNIPGASSRLRQQQDQQRKPVNSLLELDMSGLHTAVHVAQSLGQLEDFRQHYLMQRRLQITADLQAPQDFLASYQAFLAQVAVMQIWAGFQLATCLLQQPAAAACFSCAAAVQQSSKGACSGTLASCGSCV